jgi:hypothetical protein
MDLTESDLKNTLSVERVESMGESIDKEIARLTELKTKLPARIEHIKTHIVEKYNVTISKHKKSSYRDTNLINGEYVSGSFYDEVIGSNYYVRVEKYTYDTSLIGKPIPYSFSDEKFITIPQIQTETYQYNLTKSFSWKKKALALQYANEICARFGITLKKTDEPEDKDYSTIYATGKNNAAAVWNGE